MSAYIDIHGQLHLDQPAAFALTCPHCLVYTHVTPLGVPSFNALNSHRPRQVGIVFDCDACHQPLFLRFAVRQYGALQIELGHHCEVERARERFNFQYLPREVEELLREAFGCYVHGMLNAFGQMCRRCMQALFADQGEAGRLRMYEQLHEVRDMTQMEGAHFNIIRRVLFDTDADPQPPLLDEVQAGMLMEVIKDLLHQAYVRRGRLQQALKVRQFLSDESARSLKT
ncbi:MAG: hypothetical protein QM718_00955 [Steroidobacteraceae bacterium]